VLIFFFFVVVVVVGVGVISLPHTHALAIFSFFFCHTLPPRITAPLLLAFSPSVPAAIAGDGDIVEGVSRVRRAVERAMGDGGGKGGRIAFVREITGDPGNGWVTQDTNV
jgi:hypothetical protein